jgi:ADP-heptose:LPS heptosyltransferase
VKVLRSKRANIEVVAPVKRGYRVRFDSSGKAVVPDEVADVLVAMGQGFYTVAIGNAKDALTNARVLVVRDMGLGDVLLTTPLIRKLATDFAATVDVLTLERYRCLFDGNPYVREVRALETDGSGERDAWDVVLDLRSIVENAENAGLHRHRADAFCEFADITLTREDRRLDYYLTDKERTNDLVTGIRNARETNPEQIATVAYVVRSTTDNRNWSDAKHRQVIRALIAAGYGVILLDGAVLDFADLHAFWVEGRRAGRWPWGTFWNATGDLALRDVLAVLAACDACLAPDTGLFHAAGALGVPTVCYFGAFPAEERHTHQRLAVLNEPGNCSLLACRRYFCLNRGVDNQPRCLDVSPERIVGALDELLGTRRREPVDLEAAIPVPLRICVKTSIVSPVCAPCSESH